VSSVRQAAEALDVLTGEPFGGLARSAEAVGMPTAPLTLEALPEFMPAGGGFEGLGPGRSRPPARSPSLMRPSAKALKAEALERRDKLLDLLDRLAAGARPTREEAIDAVLAVIEDAHSANPVLFGAEAARHFARLHQARSAPRY